MLRVIKGFKDTIKRSGDYFYYVFATVMHSGLHFVFSIYVKTYVDPLEYGMYSSCLLLQTYLMYLQLGSLNAFNRDYPQLMGGKKYEDAKDYRNTTFTFLLAAFGIAILLIWTALLVISNKSKIDSRYLCGFAFCATIAGLTIIENFGASRTRVEGKFKYVSTVTLLETISLVIGAVIVSRIGYYGIYITTVVGMLIGIAFYWKNAYSDIRLKVNKQLLRTILLSGLPLLVNGLIWTVVNSIDKFVILGFINTEALGVYAIAQNAFSYMVLVPTAISQLFYVKMGRAYGENEDVNVLTSRGVYFTSILAVVISFLSEFAYFLSPILVEKIMPNYVGGIKSAQILILGLAIYAPTLVNGNILTILKKNAAILRGSIYLCILNAICSTLFVLWLGADIENVALGTVTAYIGRTIIIIYQLKKYANCSVMAMLKCSVFPVLAVIVVSIFMYRYIPNRLIGLAVSVFVIGLFYALMYHNKIKEILKGAK